MILTLIYIFFFIIYLYYEISFINHLRPLEEVLEHHHEKVTIIISARNEEKNLPNLFNALLNQNYDLSKVEIIIANDYSSDDTSQVIESYQKRIPNFISFIPKGRDQVNSPKKNALKQAIAMTSNEIILMTDADCIPCHNWINGMVDVYVKNPKAHMIIGFSETILPDFYVSKLYSQFEHFDFHTLMFATQASLNMQKVFSGSGQNFSFKKSAYNSVGGYDKIMQYLSGDDIHLMQLFAKNGKVIQFANNQDARVQTQPIHSLAAFINQRSRWASNMKVMLFSNLEFFLYLISVFLVLTLIPFLLILYPLKGFIFVLIKLWADYTFIRKGYGCFRLNFDNLRFFILWFLLQPIYTLLVSILGFLSFFKWKDRKGFR